MSRAGATSTASDVSTATGGTSSSAAGGRGDLEEDLLGSSLDDDFTMFMDVDAADLDLQHLLGLGFDDEGEPGGLDDDFSILSQLTANA